LERILEAGHAEAVIDEVRGESAIPVGTRTRTRPQEEPVETKVDSRVSDAEVRNLEGHLRETAAVVLQGPPGTGKTRRALQLVEWLANDKRLSGKDPCSSPRVQATQFTRIRDAPEAKTAPVVWEIVQLHPGYAYEDLVRGLAATAGGGFGFEPRDGIVIEMARLASERKGQPTILILDEINRCNLAAALGELILVLEKGYRGLPVRLQYEPPSGRTDEQNFRLPENLWIIGTMNTADRSIAMVDFAIRRRFRFIDVLPDPDVLDEVNTPGAAKRAAREAFERFAALLGGGDDRLAIGHSYFIVQGDEADWAEKLARRLIYEVLPLAREYSQEGLLRRGATADFGPGLRLDPAEPPLRHLAESAVADALRHLGESHDD
jgi:MoxR-like ATPase